MPSRPARKRFRGSTEGSTQRKNATHLNQVWSYDFIFDQTADGGCLKWLPIADEYSRELLSLEVARSMTAEDVVLYDIHKGAGCGNR